MYTCSGNIHEYRYKLITVILIQLNILLKGTFQFVDMLVQEDSSETCKITSFVILIKIYDIQINYVNLNVNTLRMEENNWRTYNIPGRGGEF